MINSTSTSTSIWQYLKFILFAIMFISLASCQSSATQSSNPVNTVVKNGKVCGQSRGSFLGSWFDYYERGLSFADCSMWVESESDLRKALNKRSIDKRRVYSLGMHLISDYFPNRELGVALYYQQQYEQAKKYLLTSLSQFPSAKAEEYLKRTRIELLKKNPDTLAPTISIDSPASNQSLKSKLVTVSGAIVDNNFIDSLTINNQPYLNIVTFVTNDNTPVRISRRARKFNFEMTVPVLQKDGRAFVEIIAKDISGNQKVKRINLVLDQAGPQINVNKINYLADEKYQLQLSIQDENSDIKQVNINGKEYQVSSKRISNPTSKQHYYEINLDKVVSGPFDDKHILVIAKDALDNKTQAVLKADVNKLQPKTTLIEGAESNIDIILLKDELTRETQENKAYISGEVESDSLITSLTVNGQNIIRGSSQHLYFNYNPDLQIGKNIFKIIAQNKQGQKKQLELVINRKEPMNRSIKERLMLAHLPFSCNQVSREPCRVSNSAYDVLFEKQQQRKRFQLSKKELLLKLIDQSNDCEKTVSDECAISIAEQLIKQGNWDSSFDNALFTGSIIERQNEKNEVSVEISGRIIDYQTKEILTTLDIYAEKLNKGVFKDFSQGLITELADSFPIVDSEIISINDKNIELKMIEKDRVWEQMPLLIYNQDKNTPCTSARIIDINDKKSNAKILTKICQEFNVSDFRIITR
ncbi:MAG: hypothetical protein HQL46_12415 [Gammaproteobacteria bacterium]|nr:hypothetical protein [Gammaproteobacteria bacterium]